MFGATRASAFQRLDDDARNHDWQLPRSHGWPNATIVRLLKTLMTKGFIFRSTDGWRISGDIAGSDLVMAFMA